jgi:hypothetical protein
MQSGSTAEESLNVCCLCDVNKVSGYLNTNTCRSGYLNTNACLIYSSLIFQFICVSAKLSVATNAHSLQLFNHKPFRAAILLTEQSRLLLEPKYESQPSMNFRQTVSCG